MPKFTAPDGTSFDTRPAFRDYMMANYYSVRNKSDVTEVKKAGDVDGQVFEIGDCKNVTVVVMDHISQLNIDNCVNSKIFIGACAGSIFIRNCSNTTLYSCCQQLRLRDCVDSQFFTFSQSEVHIELSSACRFGPFHGGYPEHEEQLQKAGLDAEAHSLWYQIFDHNDPDKHGNNWSLMPDSEWENAAWFPADVEVLAVVPTPASAASQRLNPSGQVGEAFGVDQMKADAEALKAVQAAEKPPSKPPAKMPIETALMIASALAKRMNIKLILTMGTNRNFVSTGEFAKAISDLAGNIGSAEDADQETKDDLTKAISPNALDAIFSLCAGTEADSVDVDKFLAICEAEVEMFLSGLEEEAADQKGAPRVSESAAAATSPSRTIQMSTPQSPYDEEVAFNLEEEEEAETVCDNKRSPMKTLGGSRNLDLRRSPQLDMESQSVNRILELQREVRRQVEAVVKKTDLYHTLQVKLGYTQPYNALPARGTVLRSESKPWIPMRDIQNAFVSARLRLSDVHVRAMIKDIKEFARSETEAAGLEQKKIPVFHAMKVNANWLKRYLKSLRLPQSKSYEAWTLNKRVYSKSKRALKPKEFERALSGYECSLTREEIEDFIYKNHIVPEEFMKEEILRRLASWVADTDGRRELQSKINFELNKWQKANPTTSWKRLSVEERQQIRLRTRNQLIAKKKTAIETSEYPTVRNSSKEKGCEITLDLYWKYDSFCKRARAQSTEPPIFGDWLKQYGEKFARKLEEFNSDFEQRKMVSGVRIERRHSVAALREIEKEVRSSIDSFTNVSHKVELRKSLERLKKDVAEKKIRGLGDGTTVTKEDFDKHLELVIAPRLRELQDNSVLKILAYEARKKHDGMNLNRGEDELTEQDKAVFRSVDDIFLKDQKDAIKRAYTIQSQEMAKSRENFSEWLEKKKENEQKQRKAKEEELRKEVEEQKRREAEGKKAYKKWLRLRKKNAYKSKSENLVKSVPEVRRADHYAKGWNKDVDLADYYANMDNML